MDHVDTYLMHHGVKGQQWGNKHGPPYPLDDNPSKQAYKKKKAQQESSDSRKEQKRIAKQERAEYKKKKLPRTSLGLALKNSTMSDAEFREASKKLKRDREVYDGIISDMYRLERAVNLPGMFLNDGVKAIKNIDYIYGLITGSSMTEARRMLARSNSISNRMVGKKNTRIAKNNTGLYYGVGSYLSGDSPRAGGSAAYKNFLDSRLSTKMGDAIPMNMISTSEYDRLMSQFKHSDMSDSNYLQHYGVLGMKWGRRKVRPDVNSERREKLNKVKAKVRENLKPWQISGSYKQNTYNHNQSPYQETTKVTASGGININPLSAEKTNEYAQKIYELKQRIPRLYHSDFIIPSIVHSDIEDINNFLCHYGRKGMKWGQHIFGEDDIKEPKRNGWDKKRFERLKKNYNKSTGEDLGKLEYYDDTELLDLLEQDYSKYGKDPDFVPDLPKEKSFEPGQKIPKEYLKTHKTVPLKIGKTVYNLDKENSPLVDAKKYNDSITKAVKSRKEGLLGINYKANDIDTAIGALRLESTRKFSPNGGNKAFFNGSDKDQVIHRIYDNSGNCSLVYARHPKFGDLYIKGIHGNIEDTDLSMFKKKPDLGKIGY